MFWLPGGSGGWFRCLIQRLSLDPGGEGGPHHGGRFSRSGVTEKIRHKFSLSDIPEDLDVDDLLWRRMN